MTTQLPTEKLDERLLTVKAPQVRVYFRQSLDKDQQQESIPTQRAECKRLANAIGISDLVWARASEYPDVDRAGDDFAGREQLTKLVREAQRGDIIIAWKQDRLGRDMIDAAATIRELVKYRGCTLYTVENGTNPVRMDTAEQTASVMLKGMISQGELESIRSRTRASLRQRARDGFATGTLPFGYRGELVDPTVTDRKKSKKRIVIVEEEAKIVRRIYLLYLDHHGYTAIARILNKEGAPSPRGTGWCHTGVWETLRNPCYAGEWTYGRRRVVGRVGRRKLVEKAAAKELVTSNRPELAVVSPDLFAKVQVALAERSQDMKARCAAYRHMLSGTLRCGACGGPMRIKHCDSRRPDWKKRYYVCGAKQEARCAMSIHVPADDAERAITEHVRVNVLGEMEELIRKGTREDAQRDADNSNARALEAEQLRAQVDTLRAERQRLVRLAVATDETLPEIADALRENQQRSKVLEVALAKATRPAFDQIVAEQQEAETIARMGAFRDMLGGPQARDALKALFPAGLTFRVDSGIWLIEGSLSGDRCRHPDTRPVTGRKNPLGASRGRVCCRW